MLAEVDLAGPDVREGIFEPPAFCLAEVSRDERFTGGRLADYRPDSGPAPGRRRSTPPADPPD